MDGHEVFRMELLVTDSDIDIMGHVNNVSYVRWMQDVAVAHSNANGWDWPRYRELGAAWVARMHKVEYLASAYKDDGIVVETWVSGIKKATSTRSYRFQKASDGATLVMAETRWAFVSLSDAVPVRIPPEVSGSFQVISR